MSYRERSQVEAIQEQVAPYKQLVDAIEVTQRLDDMALTLSLDSRNIITSNDRYQVTAAYLGLAQARFAVTEAIVTNLSSPSKDETKHPGFTYKALGDDLLQSYQGVKTFLDSADIAWETRNFAIDHTWTDHLGWAANSDNWLQSLSRPTGRVLRGVIAGISLTKTSLSLDQAKLLSDSTLPNSFKFKLKDATEPLVIAADGLQRTVDRIAGRGFELPTNSPVHILETVSAEALASMRATGALALWLTLPKFFDGSFELANPLDESGKRRKSFTAPVKQVAPKKAAAKLPSGKPFNADALKPEPAPIQKKPPARPFDESVLTRSAPSQAQVEKPSGKPFNAAVLKTARPKTENVRPFTTPKPAKKPPANPNPRPFDPKKLRDK